jgi:uncharacterized Zn finger protein (UPF0148 family)
MAKDWYGCPRCKVAVYLTSEGKCPFCGKISAPKTVPFSQFFYKSKSQKNGKNKKRRNKQDEKNKLSKLQKSNPLGIAK